MNTEINRNTLGDVYDADHNLCGYMTYGTFLGIYGKGSGYTFEAVESDSAKEG
jgi:hypothetical protein